MTLETPRQKLAGIQGLRGIAALLVVFYHLGIRMEDMGWQRAHLDVTMAGVDIFFVISGFIMWVTTAARPERTAASFLRDRFQRIAPAYWILTALIVVAMVLVPQVVMPVGRSLPANSAESWWHVVSSFLFIASTHPIKGDYQPVLTAGWTLNLEMFFYVIFAIAIANGRSSLTRRALVILLTLAGLAVIGFVWAPRGVLAFYTQDLLLEFGGGVLLGIAYSRGWVRFSRLWWAALALGWCGLIYAINPHFLPRSLEWGVPALLIVSGTVFAPALGGPLLQKLGDCSYSLYITHQISITATSKAWAMSGISPNLAFPVVALAISIGAAWLFYQAVERPLTRHFERRRQRHVVEPAIAYGSHVPHLTLGSVAADAETSLPAKPGRALSDGQSHV